MDKRTFKNFSKLIYELSGISLGENKLTLVNARINKRMRVLGIEKPSEYFNYIMRDTTGEEIVQLLDVISTNVTDFFREPEHFELLGQIFSCWLSEGQRRFRFWSAACSTGEEPYSMAMVLCEHSAGIPLDMKILATDISTRVLEHASIGSYDRKKISRVPLELRLKYFEKEDDECYRVSDSLKKLVVFRRLNLSQTPLPLKGPLDIIFMRNVMIYFDSEVRKRLLDEAYRLLKPGGYLMVGHAEGLAGLNTKFETVKASIYYKPAENTRTNLKGKKFL